MRPLTPDGFADRFKACSRTLWCVAVAIVSDADRAEDVVQEAAIIALQKLQDFDPDTTFAAWMSQIVRYVALNHARRRANERVVNVDAGLLNESVAGGRASEPAPISGRGELAPDQRSFDDRVMAALGTVEETARACLLLRTVLDMPYREISRSLGIPEGTAMSHVHRARRALSERLYPTARSTLSQLGVTDE